MLSAILKHAARKSRCKNKIVDEPTECIAGEAGVGFPPAYLTADSCILTLPRPGRRVSPITNGRCHIFLLHSPMQVDPILLLRRLDQ